MFLQGRAVKVNTSACNPDAKKLVFKAPEKYKTLEEKKEEEYQQFLKKRKKSSNLRHKKPFVPIRPSSARSSKDREVLQPAPIRPITPYASSLSDVYNANYHHMRIILKQNEIPSYEKTLEKMSVTPKSARLEERPLSSRPSTVHSSLSIKDSADIVSASPPYVVPAREIIIGEASNGKVSYEDYITALRYQEVKLLEEKRMASASRSSRSESQLGNRSTIHERWYELKDTQFTREIQKFNDSLQL